MLCADCQARDNVKFLTTLERHFKAITTGPLAGILDTLPPLMNALRMVWIISHHYSDDARMGSLFARIGQEIADRVENAVTLHSLFKMPAAEALELLRGGENVLKQWFGTYMQVSSPDGMMTVLLACVLLCAAGVALAQRSHFQQSWSGQASHAKCI